MSKPRLIFYIEDTEISVEEMGQWVASIINFPSESLMEAFSRDATNIILSNVGKKVYMSKAQAERARVRREWIKLHPPNHAGYWYCHIGGEWVHETAAELDHIVPLSVQRIDTDEPGWDEKLRMSCNPHNTWKGSSIVQSKTLEYAPPDGDM